MAKKKSIVKRIFRWATYPKKLRKHNATHDPIESVSQVQGNHDDFLKSLETTSRVVMIVGRRGSGKSALGFRLLENIHSKSKRPCFALGVGQALMPKWIKEITNLEEAKAKGIVLVDEGAISFSSRESMKKENIDLGKLLAVARHKDLSAILVTQNTSMIDKNVLRLCDSILLKEGSLLQEQMERGPIKKFYEKAKPEMDKVHKDERMKAFYVLDAEFEGLCKSELPSFWSSMLSKSHAKG